MFGYVNICKDELKIKDFRLFKSHYCGLCKAIAERGSNIARLGLSYDMTFLALVLCGIDNNDIRIRKSRCIAHMHRKHDEIYENKALDYTADMSIILTYLKFYDDLHDDKTIKALTAVCMYKSAVRKAKKHHENEYGEILALLKKLSVLEKKHCDNIDFTADCFADILKIIFAPPFITDESTRRTLQWLGYNIGRWIYIVDAFADIEKDIKTGSYNTFVLKYGLNKKNVCEKLKIIAEEIQPSLDYTLSNAASAYELLKICRNKDILENIIYIGLKQKQDFVLNRADKGGAL